MEKKILTYPNDEKILSQKSVPVLPNEDVSEIIQNLRDTLKMIPEGRGLSAIQIGIPKQICICLWNNQEVVMINPIITRTRGEQKFLEGCLSAPGKQKEITRAQKVWCSYLDEKKQEKEIAEGGRMSDIIQHELDHFEGICKVI